MINWSLLSKGRGGSLSTRGLKVIKDYWEIVNKYINKESDVLDIGCNKGSFLSAINVKRKVGVDIDNEVMKYSSFGGYEFYNNIRKVRGKFDLITMFQVIEHLTDDERDEYLEFCNNHLKDSGHLIITTPNISCPKVANSFWYDITHKKPIPYKDFKTILKARIGDTKVYRKNRVKWFRLPYCLLGGDIYLDLLFDTKKEGVK